MRFERRMSDADALLWRNEKDPALRSTIVAIALLDQAPARDRLEARLDRTSRLVPRLRQRVVSSPLSVAPPRWEVDPDFDLRFHLRWFRAAGPGGLDDVLRIAEPVAMQGFDRSRPLWEMLVVEGLADEQAAVILKLHHSIADGVGMVQIGMNLFDVEREATEQPMPDAPPAEVLGMPARVADALEHERRRVVGIASRVPGTAASAMTAVGRDASAAVRNVSATLASIGRAVAMTPRPMSPIMTGRSLRLHLDSLSTPVDDLKRAARRAEGRLNDAFVAAVIGGLRRYHDRHGVAPSELRMGMPINIRGEDQDDLAGNAFAPTRFAVPLGIDDPIERMRAVRALVARQRAEPAMALLDGMAMVVQRLPTSVSTAMFQSMLRGQDFVTSNVPGIPIPLYLAGSRVIAEYPFGPLSGAAANFTLLSYEDQAYVGINSDLAAIPDSDVFAGCVRDGFDEIRKVG